MRTSSASAGKSRVESLKLFDKINHGFHVGLAVGLQQLVKVNSVGSKFNGSVPIWAATFSSVILPRGLMLLFLA